MSVEALLEMCRLIEGVFAMLNPGGNQWAWGSAVSPPALRAALPEGFKPSPRKVRLVATAYTRHWAGLREDEGGPTGAGVISGASRACDAAEDYAELWQRADLPPYDSPRYAPLLRAMIRHYQDPAGGWMCCAPDWQQVWTHFSSTGVTLAPLQALASHYMREVLGDPYRQAACALRARKHKAGAGGRWAVVDPPEWHCLAHPEGVVVGETCSAGLTHFAQVCDDPEARLLAQAAYEERGEGGALDPTTLAALADRLEERGCGRVDVLRHLRGVCPLCVGDPARAPHQGYPEADREACPCVAWGSPGKLPVPHMRGCWALDLITGRA